MAEVAGIATSALAIAEFGFRLADIIHNIRKAGQQLQPVADYVKLTSTVLEQLEAHLGDDDLRSLYKPQLLSAADEALEGCKNAYLSLQLYHDTVVNDG